jgi:hypothetical protein
MRYDRQPLSQAATNYTSELRHAEKHRAEYEAGSGRQKRLTHQMGRAARWLSPPPRRLHRTVGNRDGSKLVLCRCRPQAAALHLQSLATASLQQPCATSLSARSRKEPLHLLHFGAAAAIQTRCRD